MNIKINNSSDFRRWVKIQMAYMEITQRQLAKKMGIAYPRICEAIHDKPSGKKYIIPLIEELGGDIDNFKEIL